MATCFATLQSKYQTRYQQSRPLNYHDFDYFCFHTPFAKMVQKAFYHLVITDILTADPESVAMRYPIDLLADLSKLPSPLKSDDPKVVKVMQQHLAKSDWQAKCERTLHLAKNLGNIYTGSLYNGLLSLLQSSLPKEEGGEGLDLTGKRIMMFSYGSGCAASMFIIKV